MLAICFLFYMRFQSSQKSPYLHKTESTKDHRKLLKQSIIPNIVEISSNNKDYTIRFDCLAYQGSIIIYLKCTNTQATIKENLWFSVIFEEGQIKTIEYDPRAFINSATLNSFITNVNYNNEYNTLTFYVDSTYLQYMDNPIQNLLQCYNPPTPEPTKIRTDPDITNIEKNSNNDYTVYFSCFVYQGIFTFKLKCTNNNAIYKEDLWFKVTFEEGKIKNVEHDPRQFLGTSTLSGFVKNVEYHDEDNTMTFNSGSVYLLPMDDNPYDNELQCYFPPQTPPPTEVIANPDVISVTKNNNDYTVNFNCFVYQGIFTFKLKCTNNNAIYKEDLWFKVTFEEGKIKNVEHDPRQFLGTSTLSGFVTKVEYHDENNTMTFNSGSVYLLPMDDNPYDNELQCFIPPTASPLPTEVVINPDSPDITKDGYNFTIHFNCFAYDGHVIVFIKCTNNQAIIKENLWFKVIFEKGSIKTIEYDARPFLGTSTIDNFINNIMYHTENDTLTFNTGSMYLILMDNPTEMSIQCFIPPTPTPLPTEVVINPDITNITKEGYDFTIHFNCFAYEGYIKVFIKCTNNQATTKENIWFKVIFEKGSIKTIEYDNTQFLGTSTIDNFVNNIMYHTENDTLTFNTGSMYLILMDNPTEMSIQCFIPPTPTPLPTEVVINPDITNITKEGYDFTIHFNCLAYEGYIKVFIKCTNNQATTKENIWFKVIFEKGSIKTIEYDNTQFLGTSTIDNFVNNIMYHTENDTLTFNTGSMHLILMDNPTEMSIQCFIPPTSTPTIPVAEEIVFDNENFTENQEERTRIEKIINPDQDPNMNVLVNVIVSKFDKAINDDGGAIHLKNCGIKCDKTEFIQCRSDNGGGGGIYIHNSANLINNVNLDGLLFDQCQADYGGAIYIYSSEESNTVFINKCHFTNNIAKLEESENNLCGGAAIFLTVLSGNVKRCRFKGNIGTGGSLKLLNDFVNKNSRISAFNFLDDLNSLIISHCTFEIEENSKNSIFYVRGNNGPRMELRSCTFTGKIENGAKIIDGKSINEHSPKLLVKSCMFSGDYKNELMLIQKYDFISIKINDQIFDQKEKTMKKKWASTNAFISICSLFVVIAIILIILKKKENDFSISHEEIESNELPENEIVQDHI